MIRWYSYWLGLIPGKGGKLNRGTPFKWRKTWGRGALHLLQWVIWLLCTLFTQHWRSPFVCTCILNLCLISISVSGWAQSCPTAGRNCWQCQQQHLNLPFKKKKTLFISDVAWSQLTSKRAETMPLGHLQEGKIWRCRLVDRNITSISPHPTPHLCHRGFRHSGKIWHVLTTSREHPAELR